MSWSGENSEATIQNSPEIFEFNHMQMSSDIHPCSGFKRRRICLPFLPEEIIFKILLCLPVDIIYNVMRYVCREWYNIIKDPKFIDAHLQESPTGFLIQFPIQKYSTLYLEMREHGVEITDLNLFSEGDGKGFNCFQPPSQSLLDDERISHSHESLKFPGSILASCNGLVLVFERKCFYVANPISRQWMRLPPLIGQTCTWRNAGLGYADSCKAYKVAYTYYTDAQSYHCAILTLGVDKAWRCITSSNPMPCIPREDLQPFLYMGRTYSTGGYVHWVCSPYVLSLEVETESFHVSVVPNECSGKYEYFLAMEHCLSVASVLEKYIFELWALVDVERSHWKKLQKIDFAAQIPVIEKRFGLFGFNLSPVALLKNGELFIVGKRGYLVIYNVKTEAIDYVKAGFSYTRYSPFIKSLVSITSRAWFHRN